MEAVKINSSQKTQSRIIILMLLVTPLLNINEIYLLIFGGLESQTESVTPTIIKLSKDILTLSLIFYLLWNSKTNLIKIIGLIIYILALTMSVIPSIENTNNVQIILAGLRWAYPFIILFTSIEINEKDARSINPWISLIFSLHLITQITQTLIGTDWHGLNILGLPRSPGIYLIANSAAFFVCFYVYFNLFIYKQKYVILIIKLVISIFSLFLIDSGTGYVMVFLLILLYFDKLPKIISATGIAIAASVGLLTINLIVQRDDYLEISGGTRIEILLDAIEKTSIYSELFGSATNTYVLMNGEGSIISDSAIASIIYNTGLLGIFAFTILAIYGIIKSNEANLKHRYPAIILLLGFSATTIVNEIFPMGIILLFFSASNYLASSKTDNE